MVQLGLNSDVSRCFVLTGLGTQISLFSHPDVSYQETSRFLHRSPSSIPLCRGSSYESIVLESINILTS